MTAQQTPADIKIVETPAKLPTSVWQSLYTAAAGRASTPIIMISDGGRQFYLLEAEDFARLQRYWVEYQEPERTGPSLRDRVRAAQAGG